MRHGMKRHGGLLLCLLVWCAGSSLAHADARTDYLVRLLTGSSQFRVRAQAAISLGTVSADSGVGAALIAALSDEHPAVRAAVANSLGKVGTATALPALGALAKDSEAPVRAAAAAAVARLSKGSGSSSVASTETTSTGPPRFYLAVGRPGSKVPAMDEAVLQAARQFIRQRVGALDGVLLAPEEETAAEAKQALKRKKLTGYYLESAVTQLEERDNGATRVAVSVIVATYPDRDMRAILQGAATAMGQGGDTRRQALEGAFNGALRKLPQALR